MYGETERNKEVCTCYFPLTVTAVYTLHIKHLQSSQLMYELENGKARGVAI
jgi:hypothetical protein